MNCYSFEHRNSVETSFYFTVSDFPLSELDSFRPECENKILCKDKKNCENNHLDCQKHVWHSELFVSDNLTGLRDVEVSSAGSRVVKLSGQSPLVVGSSRTFRVIVETDCCYDGVELSVRDVAGNEKKCVAGINPNVANKCNLNAFLVFMIFLTRFLF